MAALGWQRGSTGGVGMFLGGDGEGEVEGFTIAHEKWYPAACAKTRNSSTAFGHSLFTRRHM